MIEELSLDPEDWEGLRQTFHEAVDLCITQIQNIREQPVWQPTPETIQQTFQDRLPHEGQPLKTLLSTFKETILPYGTSNPHPRFWGWVQGSGTMAGALGEMLAGFMNCNTGGRDQIALYMEQQVLEWCKEIFGFPASASGILTSGTSMGTIIALKVARDAKNAPKRVGYTSSEAHNCIMKAFDLLGLEAPQLVPVDEHYRLQPQQLREMIAADRAAGFLPFAVIASAGTVNTGAIDDLETLASICREEDLWLHVDAAFGGLAILTPEFNQPLRAIAQADSVAFDFHKWLHVPYDAGCVLIKDKDLHRQAFGARREYLAGAKAGMAGGDTWFCDYGPELSRGFRALKIWFTFKTYGIDQLGKLISQNCSQAHFLSQLVVSNPALELLCQTSLNIVCFRFVKTGLPENKLDELNHNIVIELQTQGIAAPSTTRLGGRLAIRVCITNHRTRQEDLTLLVKEVVQIGQALCP